MRTLALVMAGGQGTRLHPLTRDRAKPAVPFGGKYRIIDFVLSNLINSGIYAIYVLVQWRSQSLIEHLKDGWQFGGMLPDHFVIPVPAQMRMGETWYQGTADAIFQNLNLIDDTKPVGVAVGSQADIACGLTNHAGQRFQLRHHRFGIDSTKKRIRVSTDRLDGAGCAGQEMFENVPAAAVHRINDDLQFGL